MGSLNGQKDTWVRVQCCSLRWKSRNINLDVLFKSIEPDEVNQGENAELKRDGHAMEVTFRS